LLLFWTTKEKVKLYLELRHKQDSIAEKGKDYY